jgi:hypothetical protein
MVAKLGASHTSRERTDSRDDRLCRGRAVPAGPPTGRAPQLLVALSVAALAFLAVSGDALASESAGRGRSGISHPVRVPPAKGPLARFATSPKRAVLAGCIAGMLAFGVHHSLVKWEVNARVADVAERLAQAHTGSFDAPPCGQSPYLPPERHPLPGFGHDAPVRAAPDAWSRGRVSCRAVLPNSQGPGVGRPIQYGAFEIQVPTESQAGQRRSTPGAGRGQAPFAARVTVPEIAESGGLKYALGIDAAGREASDRVTRKPWLLAYRQRCEPSRAAHAQRRGPDSRGSVACIAEPLTGKQRRALAAYLERAGLDDGKPDPHPAVPPRRLTQLAQHLLEALAD